MGAKETVNLKFIMEKVEKIVEAEEKLQRVEAEIERLEKEREKLITAIRYNVSLLRRYLNFADVEV